MSGGLAPRIRNLGTRWTSASQSSLIIYLFIYLFVCLFIHLLDVRLVARKTRKRFKLHRLI